VKNAVEDFIPRTKHGCKKAGYKLKKMLVLCKIRRKKRDGYFIFIKSRWH